MALALLAAAGLLAALPRLDAVGLDLLLAAPGPAAGSRYTSSVGAWFKSTALTLSPRVTLSRSESRSPSRLRTART